MSNLSNSRQAFRRAAAPIFAILSPEQTRQLADLQGDQTLADRVAELARQANEGELCSKERGEYEAYIEANNLLATLQAAARSHLANLAT